MKLSSFFIFLTMLGIPHQTCLICELFHIASNQKTKQKIKYLEIHQDGFRRDASHASPRVSTSHARAARLQQSSGTVFPVLRIRIQIRIRWIRMFLGLLDPDPLVSGMDPDPDPSIAKQK
jgi:hypothetical protein